MSESSEKMQAIILFSRFTHVFEVFKVARVKELTVPAPFIDSGLKLFQINARALQRCLPVKYNEVSTIAAEIKAATKVYCTH